MPVKDLHEKAFDEGTIVKLELFEEYAKQWLPTFIMSEHKEVWIFDFFAGTGYDIAGTAGSSIRLLRQIKNQIGNIFQRKIKINVCFNEYDENKYEELVFSSQRFLDDNNDVKRAINVEYRKCDFNELFPKCLSIIRTFPSLVYLDQNGIKFIADKFILELEKTHTTDFLYYISSSYFWRFGNTKAFKNVIDMDMEKVKQNPYKYIHITILNHLKSKLPNNSELSLYPFTIKKQSGMYGIIFGAKHKRAVDKFLHTAWEINQLNGSANFDIDDDYSKNQLDLFDGKKLNKIEIFTNKLREKVLLGKLKTNKEIYNFALEEGHISQHASKVIKDMKKEGLIDYNERSPLINYDQVYKNRRILEFKLNRKTP
jgi:three-Cys-motif partner protein